MPDLFDITHGVGDLNEYHQWNADLTLNTEADASEPRIWVETIEGLHDLPEVELPASPKVGRHGQNPEPTDFLTKRPVYAGEIMGPTIQDLRALRTSFLAAFAPYIRSEGYMDVLPQVPDGDTSPSARYFAKLVSLVIPNEIISEGGLRRRFTLTLEMSDPRFYFPDLAVEESGNPVSVTNPGTADIDPVITVPGASGTVEITDGDHGLTFRNCPSGSLVVDFRDHSAKVGSTPVELVPADSDWWDSHVDGIAGEATVTISQTGGSGVQVNFTPASWG